MKYWYDKECGGIICEPNCADEWLEHIWEIGLDYDGCKTIKDLQELVDELVDISLRARNCLHSGKIFANQEENLKNYLTAKEEQNKH